MSDGHGYPEKWWGWSDAWWEYREGFSRLRWWAVPQLTLYWTMQARQEGYYHRGSWWLYLCTSLEETKWVNNREFIEGIYQLAQRLREIGEREANQ